MQLATIISMVDRLKPNHYDKDLKTQWINEVEAEAIEQVINRAVGNDILFKPYAYDEDEQTELHIPDQFSDVYIGYLSAKIDYHNAEYDRYNAAVALYTAAFGQYAAWYRRNNMPKQNNNLGPF